MATSINQPFLDTPKTKASSFKLFLVFVTLAAVSFLVLNSSISTFLSLKYSNICDKALDQSSCLAMVSEVAPAKTNNKIEILRMILSKTSWKIQETTALMDNVHRRINDRREQAGLATCMELMEMSRDSVTDSMVALGNLTTSSHFDVHTWVSSVVADLDTCMNELHGRAKSIMDPMLKDLMSRTSACLALIVAIPKPKQPYHDNLQPLHGQLPSWVSSADSKLLDASAADINANVVVAKDGSGDYKTVIEAVESAPTNSNDRYVIYIKAGTYDEIVRIASNKRNIMLVGDGLNNTIITGRLNAAENVSTFNTPTIASNAVGFIAQDLCIQNTAGPEGYQAVALRVSGDKSVINRCKIDAYQDSLYVHRNSQFYRRCYITGTIDFIFGYAAVVLQKCRIVARKPMDRQQNMITAHNKVEPNVNTGISIQNCKITPSEDLVPVQEQFKTFFGRPWGEYATTVVMQSYIDDHIDPAGWAPWSGDFALDTLYYGEYMNRGPGADTSERVTWKGFRVITNASEAEKFTVAKLIEGQSWIKAAGVSFKEGL